jgi:4-amino-4-deoxy-L-arabinose transferase-like glycosyltransferase
MQKRSDSVYYGNPTFTFGDSFSYSESFLNLIRNGHYSFDLSRPDASLYRGPVYPFFWGAHYVIFGKDMVYQSVAVTQAILDFGTCILVYMIAKNLSGSILAARVSFIAYSFFPIFWIYIPITGTETFATSLTALTIL